MLHKFILLMALLLSQSLFADDEVPVLFGAKIQEIENQPHLVLTYQNADHWHTYWVNPGDAGIPITSKFKLDGKDATFEMLEWPAPKKYLEKGDLLGLGYDKEYAFYYPLSKERLAQLNGKKLNIQSEWLVCKKICVPGDVDVTGTFKNGKLKFAKPLALNWDAKKIQDFHLSLPQKADWPENLKIEMVLAPNGKNLYLQYELTGPNVNASALQPYVNVLTPLLQEPLTWKKEELFTAGEQTIKGRYLIEWDGEYMEPEMNLPANGKFEKPFNLQFLYAIPGSTSFQVLAKSFSQFRVENNKSSLDKYDALTAIPASYFYNAETGKSGSVAPTQTTPKEKRSVFFYIMLAFIGGLILNFMPCVLPVISIKLFGLINHQNLPKSKILKHNIAYSLGILATFFVLGSVVVALKFGGEEVGWGFQLQSPGFVAVMVIGLFVFAINLFGLFEFNTPGGRFLGGTKLKDGFAGDFVSGVIAVILSTPCSAPALGTALTFAFTSHFSMIYFIFLAVGMGLAFPFLMTGFFPKMIAFLPKPGMWMEDLKKFMGLTLLLTCIWLMDVFNSLISTTVATILLNAILIFSFFGIYAYQKMSMNRFWKLAYIVLPLFLCFKLFTMELASENGASAGNMLSEKQHEGLPWEKWSPEILGQKQQAGKLVFMDFTANWCFTCKVNEKVVLGTDGFKELVKKYDVNLLLADWTKRDNVIGAWLKKNGKVGVPAYFVQTPDGELFDLGETITLGKIEDALKKGQK